MIETCSASSYFSNFFDHLLTFIIPGGTNKPIENNGTPHHSGTDQNAKCGYPYN